MGSKFITQLNIKEIDKDLREISGLASTADRDRDGDILDPSGAKFAAEIPFLWQHRHDSPVGIAKLGKPTKDGIPFTAKIADIEEDGELKSLVDKAWQSIKAGLVKGVSIGFLANAREILKDGGYKFTDFEIYELSAVTIPANAGATIATVKTLKNQPIKLISPCKLHDSAIILIK